MARNNIRHHEHARRCRDLIPNNATTSLLVVTVFIMLMPIESSASYSGYGPHDTGKPDAAPPPPPYGEKPRMLSSTIGIQGMIYCRSGTQLTPLKGAVARISCLAIDTRGYETAPFGILSGPADANGYFFATLSPSEVEEGWRLSECKVFLHSSPAPACSAPTDVNNGISGALLSNYALKSRRKMKLYTVGPFIYASGGY